MGEKNLNNAAELFLKIREENKLSQKELAEKIKANGGYVSMIENGKANPGKNILKRLAQAFSLNIEEILDSKQPAEKGRKSELSFKKKEKVIDLKERKNRQKEIVEISLDKIVSVTSLFFSARKAKGLTLAKMAKELGTSTSTLSKIENGKKIPQKKLVQKLASVCELPEDACMKIAGYKKESMSDGPDVVITVNSKEGDKDSNTKTITPVKESPLIDEMEGSKEVAVATTEDQTIKLPVGEAPEIKQGSISDIETREIKLPLIQRVIASADADLTDGKAHFYELRPLTQCIDDQNVEYRFSFLVDKKDNKQVNVLLKDNKIVFELNS